LSLLSSYKIEKFIYVLYLNSDYMKKLSIHLGKGVVLSAPIKLNMTYDEWVRMRNYFDSILNEEFLKQKR